MQSLIQNRFEHITDRVHFSVVELLDCTPIAMVRQSLPEEEKKKPEIFLAMQIQQLTEALNVSATIEAHQIPIIAHQLVDHYPVESLEDFVLCFRRGALGHYGPIYNRLDISVLTEWMAKYLDEKYQLIEAQVELSKDQHQKENEINYEAYKQRVPDDLKRSRKQWRQKTDGEAWPMLTQSYNIRGIEVMATSQQHAEEIIARMIRLGIVEEFDEGSTS